MPVSGKIILKIGGLNMKHKLYAEYYDIPPAMIKGYRKDITGRVTQIRYIPKI